MPAQAHRRRSTRSAGATPLSWPPRRPRPWTAEGPSSLMGMNGVSSQPRSVISGNAAELSLSWPGQQLHYKVLPHASKARRSSSVATLSLCSSPGPACSLPPSTLCGRPSVRPFAAFWRPGGGIYSCRLKVPHGNITPPRFPACLPAPEPLK